MFQQLRAIAPLMVLTCLVPTLLQAETARVPQDTKFVVHLDVPAFQQNPCGQKLIEFAKSKAAEALADKLKDDAAPPLEKLYEVLGFDPLTEIRSIVVSSSDYDEPDKSLVLRIAMRKTTGNIEGLLLGLPGYASESYGAYQIHTASPEQDRHAYGAIHTGADGNKTLLLSVQREALTGLLDQLDGKASPSDAVRDVDLGIDSKSLLSVHVLELPTEKLEGPPANIAKIIKSLAFNIRDNAGDIRLTLSMTADDAQHAEQLRQMAQGLAAMAEFAQSVDPEDEDLKKIQQVVRGVKSERNEQSVQIHLDVASAEVTRFLQEVLNDK